MDERRLRTGHRDQQLVRQRQPPQPCLGTHAHPALPTPEVSSCSAARLSRSRSRWRRSARSASDNRVREDLLAMIASWRSGARQAGWTAPQKS